MKNHLSISKIEIEQDITAWLTDYIEVNHKFYDYKFPPCPYAKAARLKGLVKITAYNNTNIVDFIKSESNRLLDEQKFNVQILIFPAWVKWCYYVHWVIRRLNKKLIINNYYAQYGNALNTTSRYPSLLKNQPYFIVIINKLSDVLKGQQLLSNTDYYKLWDTSHYNNVVLRRQQQCDKILKRKN